jgi:restriction system protein
MAIPDYQSVMLPLLRHAADEQEHSVREAIEVLADQFRLTDEERKELLPSGRQATFDNRVGWARTYMKKAGLLESPRRSYFKITDRGLRALKVNPEAINNKFLEQYPKFREFKTRSNTKGLDGESEAEPGLTQAPEQTPREAMENAYDALRTQLARELLEQIMSSSPRFFETLVVDLLVNMGYGGTRRDAGEAVGGSGDEGIDGIIKEDRLGLEVVYIQAKRWKDTVQRPEIQKFVGALRGQNARKGVFITTSNYSKGARQFAEGLQDKVVLIDGEMLSNLMIDHGVGVTPEAAYEIKRVDSDYFNEA